MFASGRCREGHGTRASPGAAGEARARQGRPAARGGYAPRGSCPASSGRQSASGRSGPAGRTVGGRAGGRRDGTPQAPRTSTRGRSRAGPLRWRPRVRARDPLGTSPEKETVQRGPGVQTARRGAGRHGVGAGFATPGPPGARRGSAGGPIWGHGRGKRPRGREQRLKPRRWRRRRRRLRASAPKRAEPQDHPRRGWRKAGKGRARGGACRAKSQGPLRASRPLRAAGAARGPPREAGPAGRGLRALRFGEGSPPRQEGAEGAQPRGGDQARSGGGPSAPTGAPRGPARGLAGVYLPPGRAPMPPSFSPARVTSGATGAGPSVGTGWGRAVPSPRRLASPPPARPSSAARRRKGGSSALRPRPAAASPAALPSGLGTLSGARPLSAAPVRLHERWAPSHFGAPTADSKLEHAMLPKRPKEHTVYCFAEVDYSVGKKTQNRPNLKEIGK
ncbi:PREDICTED: collagen alpha-2(I) chain-like [Chinchilla lanigera]|uniref:collagen alpha-2(I) chain-like n=1 Tax=Chinchilla lanigera TaxID=34839 RepID=UPI00069843E9|nr:PREDICTED: collagen alpha-2(I) chain-like [Chinchilla lanigera]